MKYGSKSWADRSKKRKEAALKHELKHGPILVTDAILATIVEKICTVVPAMTQVPINDLDNVLDKADFHLIRHHSGSLTKFLKKFPDTFVVTQDEDTKAFRVSLVSEEDMAPGAVADSAPNIYYDEKVMLEALYGAMDKHGGGAKYGRKDVYIETSGLLAFLTQACRNTLKTYYGGLENFFQNRPEIKVEFSRLPSGGRLIRRITET